MMTIHDSSFSTKYSGYWRKEKNAPVRPQKKLQEDTYVFYEGSQSNILRLGYLVGRLRKKTINFSINDYCKKAWGGS